MSAVDKNEVNEAFEILLEEIEAVVFRILCKPPIIPEKLAIQPFLGGICCA